MCLSKQCRHQKCRYLSPNAFWILALVVVECLHHSNQQNDINHYKIGNQTSKKIGGFGGNSEFFAGRWKIETVTPGRGSA